MIKIIPVALFFLSFFASLVSNAILRKISNKFNVLLDNPDKKRKFHKNPTPLTGGIGISIGIIFSGIFLFFLTDNNYDVDISTENFVNSQENTIKENTNIHEIKISDQTGIKIKVIDDESFLMILPDGEKKMYKVSNNSKRQNILTQEAYIDPILISNFSIGLLFFTIILQLIMLIDDMWGLKEINKLFFQSFCVLGVIYVSDIYIVSLGNLLGLGNIELGLFGIPFTVFCVVGMINAFNYIDGLNGLCASFCLICFASIIFMINAHSIPSLFPLILPVGAIMGFLIYNLGILGDQRNVFLGDNGSQALGFLCAWVLVYFSQYEDSDFSPVTSLWLVAILFIDALRVLSSRALRGLKGSKILEAKRDHVYHKLQDFGFSSEATFCLLILMSSLFSAIGIMFNRLFITDHYYSFYAFLLTWIIFHIFINKIPKNV
tara:strand:- start:989 stop:2290 length:1302 start_codon:yes stop_codon:yes gene_type:complete